MIEDFDLWLRMLKTFGYIHNFSEILLNYRLHPGQVTYGGGKEGPGHWQKMREELANRMISSE